MSNSALYCLKLPLQQYFLLLPGVAIAEIVPYRTTFEYHPSPSGLLGAWRWREHDLSLLSFATINGEFIESQQPPNAEGRVAILNALFWDMEPRFWGLLLYDSPKPEYLRPGDVVVVPGPEGPCVKAWVELHGVLGVIPDLAMLEGVAAKDKKQVEAK
jgi:hypothetical protein